MVVTYRSRNGRREATIEKTGTRTYTVILCEQRRYESSTRTRTAYSKPEAVFVAKAWVNK